MPTRRPRPSRRCRRGLAGVLLLALLAAAAYPLRQWREARRARHVVPHVEAAAARYGVDAALLRAVIWRESGFDPAARGAAGEFGLMQVGEIAGQEWADAHGLGHFEPGHLLDPATNVLAGAWYLAKVTRRYAATDDPVAYGLAEYNAGRANVLRWLRGAGATNREVFLEQMDFPGTRAYVRAVLAKHAEYRERGRP